MRFNTTPCHITNCTALHHTALYCTILCRHHCRFVPLFDSYMNRACVKAHTASDAYTCLIPYKMYKYLETPVFISEASNKHRPTMQVIFSFFSHIIIDCGSARLDCPTLFMLTHVCKIWLTLCARLQALTDATILGGFEAVPIKFFDPKVVSFKYKWNPELLDKDTQQH